MRNGAEGSQALSFILALVLLTAVGAAAEEDELVRPAIPSPTMAGTVSQATDPQPIGGLPNPTYPEAAKADGWAGACKVQLKISAEGEILEITLFESSGREDADAAALEAAAATEWKPGTDSAGKPITQHVTVTFTFDPGD
jgi:protein TonB